MLKRILAGLSASAVIVLTVGAAPAAALSRNMPASTDYVISLTGVADSSLSASQQNCMRPYSHDLQDALDAYDNGDIIYLCPGVYVGPFSATHGDGLTLVGANPRTTIIDGRVVMRDRQLLTIDRAALMAEFRERANTITDRSHGRTIQDYDAR